MERSANDGQTGHSHGHGHFKSRTSGVWHNLHEIDVNRPTSDTSAPPSPHNQPADIGGHRSHQSSMVGGQPGSPRNTLISRGCWLEEFTGIKVPPKESDFVCVGMLQKRRGGFGKIAQNNWKSRFFILMKNGALCYFEVDSFAEVDFNRPPRGVLSLADGEASLVDGRVDHDTPTPHVFSIQVGPQRWKLCAPSLVELTRWKEAFKTKFDLKPPAMPPAGRSGSEHSQGDSIAAETGTRRNSLGAGRRSQVGAPPRRPTQRTSEVTGAGTGGGAVVPQSPPQAEQAQPTSASTSPPPKRHRVPRLQPSKEQGVPLLPLVLAIGTLHALFHYVRALAAQQSLDDWHFYCALALASVVVACAVGAGRGGAEPPPGKADVKRAVPLLHPPDVRGVAALLKKAYPAAYSRPKATRVTAAPKPAAAAENPGAAEESVSGTVPRAGSTVPKWEGAAGEVLAPAHTWVNGSGSVFSVRGKEYITDRKKVPSGEALYELVGLDLFQTEQRAEHVATEVVLGRLMQDTPEPPRPEIPGMLVLNIQLPSMPPVLMSTAEDGPGYQAIFYFRITKETLEELKDLDNASEAVQLWARYCEQCQVDDVFKGRFKCMCVIGNMETLGLPGFIEKYNGKPTLINKSGTLYSGPNYLELDINVHRFSYVAKKGLHSLKDRFKDMVLHVGFTIEGRAPEELPERMLATAVFNYPDMFRAMELDIAD